MNLREAAENMLKVLKEDGGFTDSKKAEMIKECGKDDIGEPFTAMGLLEEALKDKIY